MTASGDVDLTWDAATDNVAVTGYRVYRDDQQIEDIGSFDSSTRTRPWRSGPTNTKCSTLDAADEPLGGEQHGRHNGHRHAAPHAPPATSPRRRSARAGSTSPGRPSTDSVGVTGYEIYRDDAPLTTIGPVDDLLRHRAGAGHAHVRGAGARRRRQRLRLQQPGHGQRRSRPTPRRRRCRRTCTRPGPATATSTLTWDASLDNVGVTAIPRLPRHRWRSRA